MANKTPANPPIWLTVVQVAKIIGISRSGVSAACRRFDDDPRGDQSLSYIRLAIGRNGTYMIKKADAENYERRYIHRNGQGRPHVG